MSNENTSAVKVPTFDALMNPTIQALKLLGGSGTIEEINNKVIELTNLTEEQIEVLHDPEKGGTTEVEYRSAWTRSYLKKYGVLENSKQGVWALTLKGTHTESVNTRELVRFVRDIGKGSPKTQVESASIGDIQATDLPDEANPDTETAWRDNVMKYMLDMSPAAFERLTQRILREAGFIQVEVTGRTGDGGIDGKGIMRLNDLMGIHVIFQCKRYKGSISPSLIRDFRGAMVGRADKGLFVTTGSFSKDAIKEAKRDGAPPIDLLDGVQLVDTLCAIMSETTSPSKFKVELRGGE